VTSDPHVNRHYPVTCSEKPKVARVYCPTNYHRTPPSGAAWASSAADCGPSNINNRNPGHPKISQQLSQLPGSDFVTDHFAAPGPSQSSFAESARRRLLFREGCFPSLVSYYYVRSSRPIAKDRRDRQESLEKSTQCAESLSCAASQIIWENGTVAHPNRYRYSWNQARTAVRWV
jgi:hypothetical protein